MPQVTLSQTIILDSLGLSQLLWGSAALTALSHHTDLVKSSPGAVLKAAEWYNQALSIHPGIAAYRYLRYGTTDTGSFDMLEARTQMSAVVATRKSLYENMCNNTFMYMMQGPGPLKQYLDHVAMRTDGQRTALNQFFAAVQQQNDTVRDAIDLLRRRTYAVKVSAEVAMVVLGAGPISFGVQVGVGLGYTLITQAITSYFEMSKADIVAMPRGRQKPDPETLRDVAQSTAAGVGMNVAQEAGGFADEALADFERIRQRALERQAARIEAKIAEIAAKSRPGKDRISKAALNTIKDLTVQREAVAAQKAASLGTRAAQFGLDKGVKAAGIGVGIYFLREDIGNVLSFIRDGDL